MAHIGSLEFREILTAAGSNTANKQRKWSDST